MQHALGIIRSTMLDSFGWRNKRLWLGTLLATFSPGNTIAIRSKKIKHGSQSINVFYLKWMLLHASLQQFWHKIALLYVKKEPLQLHISFSKLSGEVLWWTISSESDQSNLPQCQTKKRTFQLNILEPKCVILSRISCNTFHITK